MDFWRSWDISCRFINGFINRKKPLCPENRDFVRLSQYYYLMKLRDHLPKNVLDESWLQPPSILEEVRASGGFGRGGGGSCLVVATCVCTFQVGGNDLLLAHPLFRAFGKASDLLCLGGNGRNGTVVGVSKRNEEAPCRFKQ